MTRTRWAVAGALGLVAVGVLVSVLTLLSTDDTTPPAAEPGTPTTSATTTDPADALGDLTGVQADARDALAAWARPDLSYSAWWDGLRDRLAPGARTDYQQTDPAGLPALRLERVSHVADGPSDDTKTVFFVTSDGRFGVDMSRRPSSSTWLATRVLFPGQESSLR